MKERNRIDRYRETSKLDGASGTMRALGSEGLQAHEFESCPRSECSLGFITRGNGFLAGGL
ncbi:hypothetical protein E2C01_027721 [Portunus trituberculatus]|uniref:Uncharacterized protein n=1 Tax=Portunus trituberculatus TaxID=210409 RepID=A0A5B7EMA9_PORTR|nr:hypothetical protein [Portunus trituberculatus]